MRRDQVLVISHRDDIHAWAVLRRLTEITGSAECGVLFDTATFPMATDVVYNPDSSTRALLYPALPDTYGAQTQVILRKTSANDKRPIDFSHVQSIYWRRPRHPIVDNALKNRDLRLYAAKSSRETLIGIVESFAIEHLVVNPPGADERAALKVLQLNLAKQLNLAMPKTLVTNDPEEASKFIKHMRSGGKEVISKSPADLYYFPAQTELVDEERLNRIGAVRFSPTILQERICGGLDLRITVVGCRAFGMAQTSSLGDGQVDSRIDTSPICEPFTISEELLQKILLMQEGLGLRFGAYDFKCDSAGTPYFLEVNPSGQWLYVEIAVQQPIAEALALYLLQGPGAEFRTRLPALTTEQLNSLVPVSLKDEYRRLMRTMEKQRDNGGRQN